MYYLPATGTMKDRLAQARQKRWLPPKQALPSRNEAKVDRRFPVSSNSHKHRDRCSLTCSRQMYCSRPRAPTELCVKKLCLLTIQVFQANCFPSAEFFP